jgi:hypothetical protein
MWNNACYQLVNSQSARSLSGDDPTLQNHVFFNNWMTSGYFHKANGQTGFRCSWKHWNRTIRFRSAIRPRNFSTLASTSCFALFPVVPLKRKAVSCQKIRQQWNVGIPKLIGNCAARNNDCWWKSQRVKDWKWWSDRWGLPVPSIEKFR